MNDCQADTELKNKLYLIHGKREIAMLINVYFSLFITLSFNRRSKPCTQTTPLYAVLSIREKSADYGKSLYFTLPRQEAEIYF